MRERILEYLKKRRDGILKILEEKYRETDEIDITVLEVLFTYNAIISDIKNVRFD